MLGCGMTNCVLCKYSTLDFHDADAIFLREIYCDKGHTTSYHISFDEWDQFKCEDYKVSIITWTLRHTIHFAHIALVILILYCILRFIGVI